MHLYAHFVCSAVFVFNEMLMLWPAGQAPSGDGDGETEADAFERDWEQRRRGGGDQTVLQQEGTIHPPTK